MVGKLFLGGTSPTPTNNHDIPSAATDEAIYVNKAIMRGKKRDEDEIRRNIRQEHDFVVAHHYFQYFSSLNLFLN